ncbi:MAG: peptidoglycan recognition protein family protein [Planctomycetes bacterium]|nr:peptidoglycan recognition protein family protein [Planctomycetota bacterium]
MRLSLFRFGAIAAALPLLLASWGCKDNRQAAAGDQYFGAKPPAPPPANYTAKRYSDTITVFTPMSDEAMERYTSGRMSNLGSNQYPEEPRATFPPPELDLRPPAAPPAHAAAGGDPAWNVPLTRTWSSIVIHHSASDRGSASIFHKWHLQRGWENGLGYDFVIGNGSDSGDGEVEVGPRWKKQIDGAHAGNDHYNQHGIGICLVGNFDHERPSARQMASLERLVRFLQAKCGIPASRVIGHDDVPGKDTHCPGAHFDLAGFRARLGGSPSSAYVPPVTTASTASTGKKSAVKANSVMSVP